MSMDEYLKDAWTKTPPKGTLGKESEWLDFCDLNLKGNSLLIIDASFTPRANDGLLVELSPGAYLVQAKAMNYISDKRISRLRVFAKGAEPYIGQEIGTTWTDTAQMGICDHQVFLQSWGDDDDASYAVICPTLQDSWTHGIAVLDATTEAIMPFVSSGFGDGEFPVYELLQNGHRVGVEVEFIPSNTLYPF